jgi:hypothetical protein
VIFNHSWKKWLYKTVSRCAVLWTKEYTFLNCKRISKKHVDSISLGTIEKYQPNEISVIGLHKTNTGRDDIFLNAVIEKQQHGHLVVGVKC